MKLHPAKALFREMFRAAASVDTPVLPGYFVPRGVFHAECRKRGIDCPENIVDAWNWEISIGLPAFVKGKLPLGGKSRNNFLWVTPFHRRHGGA